MDFTVWNKFFGDNMVGYNMFDMLKHNVANLNMRKGDSGHGGAGQLDEMAFALLEGCKGNGDIPEIQKNVQILGMNLIYASVYHVRLLIYSLLFRYKFNPHYNFFFH